VGAGWVPADFASVARRPEGRAAPPERPRALVAAGAPSKALTPAAMGSRPGGAAERPPAAGRARCPSAGTFTAIGWHLQAANRLAPSGIVFRLRAWSKTRATCCRLEAVDEDHAARRRALQMPRPWVAARRCRSPPPSWNARSKTASAASLRRRAPRSRRRRATGRRRCRCRHRRRWAHRVDRQRVDRHVRDPGPPAPRSPRRPRSWLSPDVVPGGDAVTAERHPGGVGVARVEGDLPIGRRAAVSAGLGCGMPALVRSTSVELPVVVPQIRPLRMPTARTPSSVGATPIAVIARPLSDHLARRRHGDAGVGRTVEASEAK